MLPWRNRSRKTVFRRGRPYLQHAEYGVLPDAEREEEYYSEPNCADLRIKRQNERSFGVCYRKRKRGSGQTVKQITDPVEMKSIMLRGKEKWGRK